MEWYHVYLFTRLSGLNALFLLLVIASIVAAVAFGVQWLTSADLSALYGEPHTSTAKASKRLMLKTLPICMAFIMLFIAIPNQKEAAAIYLLPKIANSDVTKEADKIPADLAKLLRLKLESYIGDLEKGTSGTNKKEGAK